MSSNSAWPPLERANAQPGSRGMYAPVIAQLQSQLAALNAKATTGYADYSTATPKSASAQSKPSISRTAPPKDNNDDNNKKRRQEGRRGPASTVAARASARAPRPTSRSTAIKNGSGAPRPTLTRLDTGPATSTAIGAAGNGTARDTRARPSCEPAQ